MEMALKIMNLKIFREITSKDLLKENSKILIHILTGITQKLTLGNKRNSLYIRVLGFNDREENI